MSSEQVENVKGTAADAAEQTKQFSQEKTGAAQEQTQGIGQTVQAKAGEAQQGTADAAKIAQDKAVEAKDQGGNLFQQAGSKLTDTLNNVKGAFGNN